MLVNQVNAQRTELDNLQKQCDAAKAETEDLRKQVKEAATADELRDQLETKNQLLKVQMEDREALEKEKDELEAKATEFATKL